MKKRFALTIAGRPGGGGARSIRAAAEDDDGVEAAAATEGAPAALTSLAVSSAAQIEERKTAPAIAGGDAMRGARDCAPHGGGRTTKWSPRDSISRQNHAV